MAHLIGSTNTFLRTPPRWLIALWACLTLLGCGGGGDSNSKAASNVAPPARLSDLEPSVGGLIPAFAPDQETYTLRVPPDTTSITLTPTASDPTLVIEVRGEAVESGEASQEIAVPLTEGENIAIQVSVADATFTYTVSLAFQTLTDAPTVYAIGDSTMAKYDPATYPNQRGWAQEFPRFISGGIEFMNRAVNGRSTKTYYAGIGWDQIKRTLNAGDYVFIQFGHNDEKDDGIEGDSNTGTEAWGAYYEYLTRFVEETRELGATPILFTPVVRLGWNGAELSRTSLHDLTGNGVAEGDANYPAAMRDVAETLDCPLVDMTASTEQVVEAYGPVDAKALLYISTDNTHLQLMGALRYAELAARGLLDLGLFEDNLDLDLGVVANPTSLDFGSRFVGTRATRALSVVGLSLPEGSQLTVLAPSGFLVGSEPDGTFSSTLELAYTHDLLAPSSFYVRFAPDAAESYAAELSLAIDAEPVASVELAGSGLVAPAGAAEFSVTYALDSMTSAGSCITSGGVTCEEEAFSNLYVKDYAPLTLLDPEPVVLDSQRISILNPAAADSWNPETDIDPERYVEFAIAPPPSGSLSVDEISLYGGSAGGNVIAYRVLYSVSDDFDSPVELWDAPENPANTLTFNAASPAPTLDAGQTLHLRVYPYTTYKATEKYLALRELTLHGVSY